jgi:Flp pilus assembly protein TadD
MGVWYVAQRMGIISLLALILLGASPAATAAGTKGRVDIDNPGWGNSRAGQYLAGRSAEVRKDAAAAARYLELALGHDPNDIGLRRHVFYLMVAEGQLPEARQHARAILRSEANAFLPIMSLAVLAMQDGDYSEALSLFGRMDGGGHDGVMRALGQAWAAAGAGDLPAAQAVLNFPMNAPGWTGLSAIHRAMVEDLGGGDATATFEALKADQGGKPSRLLAIIDNFEKRQADPTIPPMIQDPGQGLSQAFGTIAAALIQAKQSRTGMVYAQLGLGLSPNDDSLLLMLADARRASDRNADAAAAYDRILPESSYFYPAQIARAHNLAQADQLDTAVSLLQDLTDKFPERSEATAGLGDMLRREQRFEEAAAAYNTAYARLEKAGQQDWQLHYTRGIARERLGDWPAAEADFTTALALQKEQPLVLNYLGYSWIDRGENLERAKDMVRKAAELRPEDGYIADSVGWAAYRTGDMVEAVQELERAILIEPLDPTINEHLGDVYWVVGRKIEARYQWERALSFDPEEKRIAGLKERLNCKGEKCYPLAKDRTPVAQ